MGNSFGAMQTEGHAISPPQAPVSSPAEVVSEDTHVKIGLALTIGGILLSGVVSALVAYFVGRGDFAKEIGNLREQALSLAGELRKVDAEHAGEIARLRDAQDVREAARVRMAEASFRQVLHLESEQLAALPSPVFPNDADVKACLDGIKLYPDPSQLEELARLNKGLPSAVDTRRVQSLAFNVQLAAIDSNMFVMSHRLLQAQDRFNEGVLGTGLIGPWSMPSLGGGTPLDPAYRMAPPKMQVQPPYEDYLRRKQQVVDATKDIVAIAKEILRLIASTK